MGPLGVYIAGTWVYGIWYIWEYWSRDMGFGTLAWYGFMRAPHLAGMGGAGPGVGRARLGGAGVKMAISAAQTAYQEEEQ